MGTENILEIVDLGKAFNVASNEFPGGIEHMSRWFIGKKLLNIWVITNMLYRMDLTILANVCQILLT
jgi:hypothetical protein